MKTKTETNRIFYVGHSSKIQRQLSARPHSWVSSGDDMAIAVRDATPESIWVASSQADFCRYFRNVHWPIRHNLGSLLWLSRPSAASLTPLQSVFKSMALPNPQNAVLGIEELVEVLASPDRQDLAIAVAYDTGTQTLTLWRGDFSRIVVPATALEVNGKSPKPDFDNISMIDYGQTIRLGRFEASVDALLYEFDKDYRRKLLIERRSKEKGFGPSLRRLRTQKRLSRAAFRPLSAKTIARIERQEVDTPRGRTLAAIAKTLRVPADEIVTY
jgi:hypothetical protein